MEIVHHVAGGMIVVRLAECRAVTELVAMNPTASRITFALSRTGLLRAVRMGFAYVVLGSGLVCTGCQVLDDASASRVQTDWDNPAVGQMAMRMYLRSHQPSRRPQQKQLLEQVGSRLAAATDRSDYDWHFELVDHPQPDIAVFPAGNVVVTEGMIAACRNEAEFAAALAHELGHMLAGHSMPHAPPNRTGSPAQPNAERVTRDARDEIEADSIALALLARAGYEPQALVSFWRHADANPERIAFADGHADRDRQLAQLESSLTQAQQIYSSNRQKQGLGIRIVRDESARPQPNAAAPAGTERQEFRWIAAADRQRGRSAGRSDPQGATKPAGWNADLVEEGDWLQPVQGSIHQAGYDWSPAGARQ